MIYIYTAADSNYFTQVATLLESLNRSQTEAVSLTVVGTGWNDSQKKKLSDIAKNYITIDFKKVNAEEFSDIKLSHGFPLATVYNLIGPKFFFSELSKIIYLDADMLIVDSLSEIWKKDFAQSVAAVNDSHIGVIGNPSMWRPWREVEVNPLAKYLNTGFMVINVKKWNNNKITEKCFDLLYEYEMPCIDQDALSLVLNGDYEALHPRFNLMPYHMMPKLRYSDLVDESEDVVSAIKMPAVIHFHRSFFGKPWNFGCSHPAVKLWRELASKSDPGWKIRFKFRDLAKEKIAKLIGMADRDVNTIELTKFKI